MCGPKKGTLGLLGRRAFGFRSLGIALEKEDERQTGGIQSLDAALHVLTTIASVYDPVTLSDLARTCSMPPSKVHRYLSSFLKAGLIQQTGRSGRYLLGPASLQLGLAAIARHDFVNAAADGLDELSSQTGMTALLCIWGSSGATVVRWERAPAPTVTSLGLGTTLPLLTSATGHAFLAWAPPAVVEAASEIELKRLKKSPAFTADFDFSREGVKQLVAVTKAQGYSSVDGRFIPGLVAIAAPILDWQHQAQAVVTLIGTDPASIAHTSAEVGRLVSYCKDRSVLEPKLRTTLRS
jgi:DNA-binding IclR family transcriptional regulator